jgi:exosortase/archaeosortase family protein
MRQVAAVTVEIVGFLDVPAVRHGNVIEIGTGTVGIGEACSGIRSLQSSVMLALLVGELFQLRPRNRVLLLASGAVLAMVANVGRTSFLTWSAAKQGLDRMHAWHGPAGLAVVSTVMGGLLLLVWASRKIEDGKWKNGPGGRKMEDATEPIFHLPSSISLPSPLPAGFLVLCCLWVPVTEGLDWAWYHWPGKAPLAAVPWSIQWPTNESSFVQGHLSKDTAELLRCTQNVNASWMDQYGNRWECVILSYAPVHSVDVFVGGHNPETCMTAAGSTFLGEVAPVGVTLRGFSMKFNHRLFAQQQRLLHIFQGTWEPFVPPLGQRLFGEYSLAGRVRNALDRRLIRGGTTLEVVLAGPATEEEARKLFQQQLAELVVPAMR